MNEDVSALGEIDPVGLRAQALRMALTMMQGVPSEGMTPEEVAKAVMRTAVKFEKFILHGVGAARPKAEVG